MIKKTQKTIQRKAIGDYLAHNQSHPSVNEIYEAVSKKGAVLSMTTVYNTLSFLKKRGMVKELPAIGGAGRRFDGNVIPHDHLICNACNTIVDIDLPHSVEIHEGQRQGFDVLGISISIYGLCPRCKSGEQEPKAQKMTRKVRSRKKGE